MINGFISLLRENKRVRVAIILLIVGVLLIIFAASQKKSSPEVKETDSLEEYRRELEDRVENLCASVEGVGKCKVYVTFSRGEQSSYKGSVLIESKPPEVMGVSVVCSGGDKPQVKRELTEMLCALFDIGTNRVAIMKLNS